MPIPKKSLFPYLLILWSTCLSQTPDPNVAKQVDSLMNEASQFYSNRDFTASKNLLLQAKAALAKRSETETPTYASCLHELSKIYYQLGDTLRFEMAEEALSIRGRVLGRLHPDYAKTLNNLGVFYRGWDNAKAEKCLLEALEIKGEVKGEESMDYARSLNGLVGLYTDMGLIDMAFEYAKQVHQITKNLSPDEEVKDVLWGLGNWANALLLVERYEEAETVYGQIIEIADGIEAEHQMMALLNLSKLLTDMSRYDEAEIAGRKALGLAIGRNDPIGQIFALQNIGNACSQMARFDEALACFDQLLALPAPRIDGKIEQAKAVSNKATIAWYRLDYEEAELLFQKSHEMLNEFSASNPTSMSNPLNNMGLLYRDMGNYEEAEQKFKEAADLHRNGGEEGINISVPINNLGLSLVKKGDYAAAEGYLLEALRLRQKMLPQGSAMMESTLSGLQQLYLLSENMDKSVEYAQQAAHSRMMLVRRSAGYRSLEDLSNLIEKLQSGNDIFLSIAQKSNDPQLAGTAFDNALFYKGFTLESNLLLNRSFQTTDEEVNQLYLQWKSLQRRLANEKPAPKTDDDLIELEKRSNDLERQLARSLKDFGLAREVVGWQQVQATLRPDEVAIEFYHGFVYDQTHTHESDSVAYYALVLRPTDQYPQLLPLFNEKELAALIAPTETGAIGDTYRNTSLYQLVWQKIEPLLSGAHKIWYSPDGLLHRVAFPAILLPDGERLGGKYEMASIGSTRQLVHLNENAGVGSDQTAAILGGVLYDVDTTEMEGAVMLSNSNAPSKFRGAGHRPVPFWKYLDGSAAEAAQIDRFLKLAGYGTKLFTGAGASEAAFKRLGIGANSPSLIHVATHGYFFGKNRAGRLLNGEESQAPIFYLSNHPLIRSGLIFAGANYAWKGNPPLHGKEDGVLTAYEISQLDLSGTELVVLSACDSGLGDIEGSEGVFGLQRAFRLAGVKHVVMSLWQVPDHASAELMGLFYTYYLRDKMEVPQALQKAQAEMAKKYSDPYLWAGFVAVR